MMFKDATEASVYADSRAMALRGIHTRVRFPSPAPFITRALHSFAPRLHQNSGFACDWLARYPFSNAAASSKISLESLLGILSFCANRQYTTTAGIDCGRRLRRYHGGTT